MWELQKHPEIGACEHAPYKRVVRRKSLFAEVRRDAPYRLHFAFLLFSLSSLTPQVSSLTPSSKTETGRPALALVSLERAITISCRAACWRRRSSRRRSSLPFLRAGACLGRGCQAGANLGSPTRFPSLLALEDPSFFDPSQAVWHLPERGMLLDSHADAGCIKTTIRSLQKLFARGARRISDVGIRIWELQNRVAPVASTGAQARGLL